MSQQENDNCITETQISGPYTSGNLTVFLIHGEDKVNSIDFLTLDEAMLGKKVVVEETGVVSVLNANNNSSEHIFIQSGDIVKGGKQDRTLQDDSILAPNSQSIKLKSFCVESGRWRRRGQESESNFIIYPAKTSN